jgi:hypothetical protein
MNQTQTQNHVSAFPEHFLVVATRSSFYALKRDKLRVNLHTLFNFYKTGPICRALLIDSNIIVVADGHIIYIDTVRGPNAPRELLFAPTEARP